MEEFEASESAKKTKTIYISTVFGIAMVLLMIGLLGLILVKANNLSRYVKENIVLNIFMDDAAHETDVLQLQKQLDANAMVKQTQYVSKELAARNLQKDLGEDFVKFLGYNPLSQSLDVYLKADYANNAGIDKFKAELMKNPLVKEVKYQQSLVDQMNQNLKSISPNYTGICRYICGTIGSVDQQHHQAGHLLAKVFDQIYAVGWGHQRLYPQAVFTLRHLARVVRRLNCCTDIDRHPIPCLQQIPDLVILRNYTEFGIVFLGVIGIGVIMSAVSTYLAVNKFLRLKIYDLYR
jgi:cell division transport system permease protein